MGLIYKFCLFFTLVLFSGIVMGQDAAPESTYRKEFYGGLNMNTSGGVLAGATFKYSVKSKRKEDLYHSFYLEVVNVRHPKEVRRATTNSSSYIYVKQNYLFSIRLMYGREYLLFKKSDR